MSTSAVTLAGFDVISLRLALPYEGPGTLEAELDLDPDVTPPTGTVDLTFAAEPEPITYQITILTVLTGTDAGRETGGTVHVFGVQGRGGMRRQVPGQDYSGPIPTAPALVAEDILSATAVDGDVSTAEQGVPTALSSLPAFSRISRSAGTARAQMGRLCARLSEGRPPLPDGTPDPIAWRMARDGTVTVGPEAWPLHESPDGTPSDAERWLRDPDAGGFAEIALDAPTLAPGMMVAPSTNSVAVAVDTGAPSPAPRRIAEVVYELDGEGDEGLMTHVRVLRATEPRTTQAEERAWVRERQSPPGALCVPWYAQVASVDEDGALGLLIEQPALRDGSPQPPCLTVTGVRYWPGAPGETFTPRLGTRCLVWWVGGREESPVVLGWESGLETAPGQREIAAAVSLGLRTRGRVEIGGRECISVLFRGDRALGVSSGPV
jgi:hypothetical protein